MFSRRKHGRTVIAVCGALLWIGLAVAAPAREVEAARHATQPAAFTFPPIQATKIAVRDDGVGVTSRAYAATRRFQEPLRVVAGELGDPDWAKAVAPYGTVIVDPRRGRMVFNGGRAGPVELVRQVRLPNGSPIAAARRGGHLFFMTDSNLSGLLVADVSDPAAPRVVATAPKGGAWTNDMLLVGDVVYAAVSGLLYAWDVSDPLHPKALPTVRCGAKALSARGSTLYFVKGRNEVGAIDIRDPLAMKVGPSIRVPGAERIRAPQFLGDAMLVGATLSPQAGEPTGWQSVVLPLKEGLGRDPEPKRVEAAYCFDLSGGTPKPLVRWTGGRLEGAAVIGGKPVALVRASRGGLAFVDASDPGAPQVVGIRPELRGSAAIHGRRLYLARRNPLVQDGGLFIYGLADLKRPTLLGKLLTADRSFIEERSDWRIAAVDDRFAYLIDRIYGILMVDVRDPAKPKVAGRLHESGRWQCIAVTGPRVFIGGDPGGLAILDNGGAAVARRVGSFMAGPCWDVAARGTVAFVACGVGLRIVETADPARPVELGSIGGMANALAVSLEGDRAYVTGDRGLGDIIDVRDLRRPRRLGRFQTREARGLDAEGNRLLVADVQEGLVIFDVRDPARPRRLGVLAREGGFTGVEVHGRHAFLTAKQGLVIVDVGDPRAPRILSDSTDARGGTVCGEYTYGAAYYGEHNLFVSDIRNLAQPRVVARFKPGRHSYGTDIAVHAGLIYLTSLPYLSILRAPFSTQAPRGRVTVSEAVSRNQE